MPILQCHREPYEYSDDCAWFHFAGITLISVPLHSDVQGQGCDVNVQVALPVAVVLPLAFDSEGDVSRAVVAGNGYRDGFAALRSPVTGTVLAELDDLVDGGGEGVVGGDNIDSRGGDGPELAHTDVGDTAETPPRTRAVQRGWHRLVVGWRVVDVVVEIQPGSENAIAKAAINKKNLFIIFLI